MSVGDDIIKVVTQTFLPVEVVFSWSLLLVSGYHWVLEEGGEKDVCPKIKKRETLL